VILAAAVLVGAVVGLINARLHKVAWHPPALTHLWLVALGFLLQFLAIYLAVTRVRFPDWLASFYLIVSQGLLLIFCLANIKKPGMILLTIGLALNLAAILSNGGFMPLPTDTARSLLPQSIFDQLTVGSRLGSGSKDILLPAETINLPWLADRLKSPAGFFRPFVFSVGDVLVALGVVWLLATTDNSKVAL
jgi:hypothetical protein